MHFFLYEIVYRIVALYLCVTSSRTVWFGIVERKIRIFSHDFIDWVLDLFLDESIKVVHRDTAPIRYWTQIGIQIFVAVACFVGAIVRMRVSKLNRTECPALPPPCQHG